MEGRVFHIIIIEQCLLGVNEFDLLRIGREMDLPVIVASEDGQHNNIVRWSFENGACDYLLKPIPMSVLKMVWKYMFFNNVSRVKNQRMSWTPDSHEKFKESVQKLGGAAYAKPDKILQLLQCNYKGFKDVKRDQVSSHLQKYRDSLKKKAQPHMLGYKDEGCTSSEHVQSRCQMEEHPPMTLANQVLKSMAANEPDILSQQQQAPATKNTQGYQRVTLPSDTNLPTIRGSTSCGNQSNALMIQMDESLPSEQKWNEFQESFLNDFDASTNDIRILEEFPSLDTFQREATPMEILKFMKASRGAPNDLTGENAASHLQKLRSEVQRMEDALRDEIMNTTYQLDLSSSPQQLVTAAGNMCLQPNVGTQVLQNIRLPLSSGTIEGTIIQDQALVANVAGNGPNNTSDDTDFDNIEDWLNDDYMSSW